MKEVNFDNKYEVIEHVNNVVVPCIYEALVDDYGFGGDDYDEDDAYDHVFQIIDGLQEVIYNYQAKRICEAFEIDPFGEDEETGEKWSSWNHMAFAFIQRKFNDQFSEQLNYML